MIVIISFNFPPNSAPASHRPFELARALSDSRIPFVLFHSGGRIDSNSISRPLSPFSSEGSRKQALRAGSTFSARLSFLASTPLAMLLSSGVEIDRALPWGVRVLPVVCLELARSWIRESACPEVWATAPAVTNLYVGLISAVLTRSRLHLDLRDLLRGLDGRPMPLLTNLALRYASSLTVTSTSLATLVQKWGLCASPTVVHNGVSERARSCASKYLPPSGGWIRVTYAGAVYGDARPVPFLLESLEAAADALGHSWEGIEVHLVSRQELSTLGQRLFGERFRLRISGELSKEAALEASATSEVNVVLVGTELAHRTAIPLKVFDLLGAGRPILFCGPTGSDAMLFLQAYGLAPMFFLDPSQRAAGEAVRLAEWIEGVAGIASVPAIRPSASDESRKIVRILTASQPNVQSVLISQRA